MKDNAFRAEMAKQMLPVHPINGPDAEKLLARMLQTPRAVADKARVIFE
jgi:hypothetical protein